MQDYSFILYLSARKVWIIATERLRLAGNVWLLDAMQINDIRILEVGAGIGTM
jgi:hypothetical protein